ncbi:MAG: hypothetical protein BWY75_02496 [bacterium ADurb.Bin425]|nr:MAG: hypothetical protein BWY75_02496 [bacterium ADurb.Bin425]
MIFAHRLAHTGFASLFKVKIKGIAEDIHFTINKPFGPSKAAAFVFQTGIGFMPLKAHILERVFPKPFGIFIRTSNQLFPIGYAVLIHKVDHSRLQILT